MTETPLSQRLSEVVRTLRSQTDSSDTLDRIVETAAQWIGGGDCHVAVSLARRGGIVETAAATDDLPRRGDQLQYELHEGPCLDAAWKEDQVYADCLSTDARWPSWAPQVSRELGVNSMLCMQLFTNESTLGALNMYSTKPCAFDAPARAEALAFAAHAAVAFAAAREIEGLNIAMDHRTTIGKAMGILMERFGLSDERAFDVLRRVSSHENRRIYDVAQEITSTGRMPG